MHPCLHYPRKACKMRPQTEGVHKGCVLCDQVVEAGVAKAKLPLWKLILLGFVAGFYIGFGALLMLNIGVSCPGLAAVSACTH
jgi:formate/nitrite transporter FocA (FNT family)